MGLQLTLAPNGVTSPSDVTPHMFSCQRSSGRARCANGKNIPSHSRTVHGASHFEASLLLFLLLLVEQLFPRYRRFLKIPVASANFGVGEGHPAVQFAQDGPPLLGLCVQALGTREIPTQPMRDSSPRSPQGGPPPNSKPETPTRGREGQH